MADAKKPATIVLQSDKKSLDIAIAAADGQIAPAKPKPAKTEDKPKVDASLLNALNKFSTNVLSHMLSDQVFATPDNFEVYFAKLLENEDSELKSFIASLSSNDLKKTSAHTRIQMETEIRHGFVQIKNILQVISLVYKNLVIMEGIVKKRLDESKRNSNAFEIQDCIKAFSDDLKKLDALMSRHINAIKANYDEVGKVFKNISAQSVYDPQYAVFNKLYFIEVLRSNLAYVKKYGYSETLMFVKVDPKVLAKIDSMNDKRGILRNIAQTLFNISRRSDVVAHYDNGCFCVLMQHTDIEGAKLACDRIRKLISQAKFFISESELKLDLQMVLTPLNAKLSAEEIISNALDGLERASGKNYEIVESK